MTPPDDFETCVFVGGLLDGQRRRVLRTATWWCVSEPQPLSLGELCYRVKHVPLRIDMPPVQYYRRCAIPGVMVLEGIPHAVLLEMLADGYRGAPAAAPVKPARA